MNNKQDVDERNKLNDIISLLMSHRSIRKFTKEAVLPAQLDQIIGAAQMASTSSNVQAYSIINITDQSIREQVKQLSGDQMYISEAAVFLVWCADLKRLAIASNQEAGSNSELYLDTTENLLVATIDTALAAQNAVVAAESLGLGAVFIGAARNNSEQLSELLQLPDLVVPLFGMCIGHPAQQPLIRPRLPKRAILFENSYNVDQIKEPLQQYDLAIMEYMDQRTGGKLQTSWSEQMKKRLQTPVRLHMKQFLQNRGWMKR